MIMEVNVNESNYTFKTFWNIIVLNRLMASQRTARETYERVCFVRCACSKQLQKCVCVLTGKYFNYTSC
jgi:hypothetical protein